ncbi:hypothetical protein [Puia dinghuensis]|uniref:hypothetical protein n=1 Tax=Puia dinghuensis TaxID=1792502 RepID=UPI001E65816D|nr:hypothetical protein [Puia dinghuensis]
MQLISTLAILPILLIALGSVYFIGRAIGIEAKPHSFSSIDGLRGFLALFLFIHHATLWYYMSQRHQWGLIPHPLFDHFGSTSVAFFFYDHRFLIFFQIDRGKLKKDGLAKTLCFQGAEDHAALPTCNVLPFPPGCH